MKNENNQQQIKCRRSYIKKCICHTSFPEIFLRLRSVAFIILLCYLINNSQNISDIFFIHLFQYFQQFLRYFLIYKIFLIFSHHFNFPLFSHFRFQIILLCRKWVVYQPYDLTNHERAFWSFHFFINNS